MENRVFEDAFSYKVIYIFRINDDIHSGKLKIGDATVHTDKDAIDLIPNCDELIKASKDRINDYTSTAGIKYELLHCEIAVSNFNRSFRDKDVHEVLSRSGYKKFYFDTDRKQNEWFIVSLESAKNAIKAVKEGRKSLTSEEKSTKKDPIILRPEQEEAVTKTIKQFNKSDRMLWNAKMRFGKTVSALEIVKRQNYKKTIILTHRPVVDEGWYEDFNMIFADTDYMYGSKRKGEDILNLKKSDKPFVYFASLQDLRGSKEVGGKFEKNEDIFNINWDFVVIDEAHEGTKTEKGITTLEGVIKLDSDYPTKILELSGTAFNLIEDYNEDEIYTWDYIMEQEAKMNWKLNHFGDPNPYEELPELKIFTYDLNKLMPGYEAVFDKAFNFREFFRVWTNDVQKDGKEMPSTAKEGQFVYEDDVRKFLDMMCISNDENNYPFSTEKYRSYFRHSLWMVPGVKEAKALSKMLHEHPVFGSGQFNIINIAGDGDEEMEYKDALEAVNKGIGPNPEKTYSITLSCGKLTTGVTVKPWTAVFMLSGSYNTSASTYLQTIFRVQSPANIGGKQKEKCYVFDFAPDRSLKMVALATRLSIKVGTTVDRKILGKFLNFCPVISIDGSKMTPYSVESMMGQLKKSYAERVVSNGFDDKYIYNDNILKLDEEALKKFDDLRKIVGASKQAKKIEKIDINNQGFTDEQYEELQRIERKPKRELTEEERRKLEELKEMRKQAGTAISILRGISIRIPLLIYGANISDDEDITVENLPDIVDDKSWEEFMPAGVSKEMFKDFSQYYEHDVFIEAGRKIRRTAKYADTLDPTERVKEIASIFSSFRNPDKETVLTPWETVNLHLGDCIGGFNFYDRKTNEDKTVSIITLTDPKFVGRGEVTQKVLNDTTSKILEINSKSGLYPLYVTYSLYRQKCLDVDSKKLTDDLEKALWNEVLNDNIYVVCKTPMAKSITNRTLRGYDNIKTNVICNENIVEEVINNSDNYSVELNNPKTWGKIGDKMNFSAIVGNPPYQEIVSSSDNNNASLGKQLFPHFIQFAIKMQPEYVSLITPSRWFSGNAQDGSFPKLRDYVRNNNHFYKIVNYYSNKELFPNVNIGPVNYFLYDNKYNGDVHFVEVDDENNFDETERPLFEEGNDIILSMNKLIKYVNKVKSDPKFMPLSSMATGRNAFGIVGKNINSISSDKPFEGSVKLRCAHEEVRYIDEKYVLNRKDVMNNWKIFTSKANGGAGLLSDNKQVTIIGRAYIGQPRSVCTDSLIPIGSFETEEEAFNLQKYMSTKFLRFLAGILKASQNLYQGIYQYVPIQDFTNNSDIDWKKSIHEVDLQLYKKYGFTEEEIEYIEKKIKLFD